MYYIVGLGNPGEEYAFTRHNTGRIVVDMFRKKFDFTDLKADKKTKSLISTGAVAHEKVTVMYPETFMNNSGKSVQSIITSEKKARNLIVVYDDLDLPLGTVKIAFNRGSGGHRGLDSIIRSIKTPAFIRVRVGVSKATAGGKVRKPQGEEAVNDFIVGEFRKPELEEMKKVGKRVVEALATIVEKGYEAAMNEYNTK